MVSKQKAGDPPPPLNFSGVVLSGKIKGLTEELNP